MAALRPPKVNYLTTVLHKKGKLIGFPFFNAISVMKFTSALSKAGTYYLN